MIVAAIHTPHTLGHCHGTSGDMHGAYTGPLRNGLNG